MKKEGIQTRKRKPKAQPPMKPMGMLFNSFEKNYFKLDELVAEKILPPMMPSQIQMPHHEMHLSHPHPHSHEQYINVTQSSAHLRHPPQ
jgi:hypothetical protein